MQEVKNYNIYGVTFIEVEVDLLTGLHQILRVDLLEDCGDSMSPEIDLGQVEGAFVMGLGYWLSEHIDYDKTSGALLNTRTWTYHPPGMKDIPIDWRIEFRKNSPNPNGILRSKGKFCRIYTNSQWNQMIFVAPYTLYSATNVDSSQIHNVSRYY